LISGVSIFAIRKGRVESVAIAILETIGAARVAVGIVTTEIVSAKTFPIFFTWIRPGRASVIDLIEKQGKERR
jgi:hypothetical protein